jgi:hypothetical protein
MGSSQRLAPAQGGGRAVIELLEGLVEAPHAAEAGGQGHLAHRKVGLVDQLLGQQHPPGLGHADRRGAQVLQEQPPQLPPADAHAFGQALDISVVERAGLDQGQGARDGVGRAVPGAQLRRGLGPAAQAGAIAGLLGRGGAGVEGDVLAQRRAGRAHRPAIDARRPHRHEQPAVEAGVAGLDGAVANVGVESSMRSGDHSPDGEDPHGVSRFSDVVTLQTRETGPRSWPCPPSGAQPRRAAVPNASGRTILRLPP